MPVPHPFRYETETHSHLIHHLWFCAWIRVASICLVCARIRKPQLNENPRAVENDVELQSGYYWCHSAILLHLGRTVPSRQTDRPHSHSDEGLAGADVDVYGGGIALHPAAMLPACGRTTTASEPLCKLDKSSGIHILGSLSANVRRVQSCVRPEKPHSRNACYYHVLVLPHRSLPGAVLTMRSALRRPL